MRELLTYKDRLVNWYTIEIKNKIESFINRGLFMKSTKRNYLHTATVAACALMITSGASGTQRNITGAEGQAVEVHSSVLDEQVNDQELTKVVQMIKSIATFFVDVEQVLAQFFSKEDSISYNACDIALANVLSRFEQTIYQFNEDLESDVSSQGYAAIKHKVSGVAEEARKHFNAAYSVIRKYNGKKPTEAKNFKNDIECVFSPEVAFSSIISRLRMLYQDVEAIDNKKLMTMVQRLMIFIEQKRNKWNKQTSPSLLTGLTIRMSK